MELIMYPWEVVRKKELSFLEDEYGLEFNYHSVNNFVGHYTYSDNNRCLIIEEVRYENYCELYFMRKYNAAKLDNKARESFKRSLAWKDYVENVQGLLFKFGSIERELTEKMLKELKEEGYDGKVIEWCLRAPKTICYIRNFAKYVRGHTDYLLKLCENSPE